MNKIIVFSILYLVLVVAPLFVFTKYKTKYISVIGWIITLILTLAGFFLAIGNEFFSQFDYDCKRIAKEMFHPQENVNFSDIQTNSNKINPYYIFLLDVSGSIKNAPKVKLTNTVKEQIKTINSSGECPTGGFSFDVKEGDDSIKYYRFLQVRLMHSILRLYERHGNNLNYLVVRFSVGPEKIDEKTIKGLFKKIYSAYEYDEDNSGKETNFVLLLNYLHLHVIPNLPPANNFIFKECFLVFFSDYLHDVKESSDRFEIEKELKSFIWEMREKSVFIKLYYLKNSKGNGLPVNSLFDEIFPKSISEVLNEDDELICPIISKTPLTFFYSNSVFEESMTMHLTFDSLINEKELKFGLGTHYYNKWESIDDMKQEYYLIKGKDTKHLSTNLQSLKVDSNQSVGLMIEGYIPAPYKSPDIIIEDKEELASYIVPVTFYKEFPPTGKLLLKIMLGILVLTSLVLFICMIIAMIKWWKNKVRK